MFEAFIQESRQRGRCLPRRRIRLDAGDGTTLFAGLFEPDSGPVRQVVILYHGAGANMNVGYLDLARDVHRQSGAVVVVPDIRGHGMSGGARGYSIGRAQVWDDVDCWIARCEQLWPGAEITLAGHSAGAIQCLNRITESDRPLPVSVQRFVAIAPYFASTARLRAQCGQETAAFDLPKFSRRHRSAPPAEGCPDPYVVDFNFPEEAARWCNLVPGYTAEMSAALSPRDIDRQLVQLGLPTVVLAAEGDVLFPVAGLQNLLTQANNPLIRFDTVPNDHLGCLFFAGSKLAQTLTQLENAA